MADMITYEELAARKAELPGVAVLTYVNSPAAVKTLSDMCCTSANVVPVLRSMPAETVLMTPDQNLAAFAQNLVPEKKIIPWDGLCPTHHRLNRRVVDGLKAEYPGARVAAHPECRPEVLAAADFIGSTSAIIKYAKGEAAREFIILTEQGVGHRLRLDRPDAVFHFPEGMICPNMKKNTLPDLRRALETLGPEVRVSAEIRRAALAPIEKMLRIT
jgi:quinolinate synthase